MKHILITGADRWLRLRIQNVINAKTLPIEISFSILHKLLSIFSDKLIGFGEDFRNMRYNPKWIYFNSWRFMYLF